MTVDKSKVVYQIYPKSFKDTTGNGIGDLGGIIEKIPYLNRLGIDMIWLSPCYPSPQHDNGYDVSDYIAINPLFGTMEDFEKMVTVAEQYDIEIMLDMVFNHCSTDHEWFQKALAGDPYYQDFFILRDEPTDWSSKFGGSAWAPFGDTGKYYLHLFDKSQADLNWRNPHVREALFKVVNFWLNKGVKGLRFDVINLIGKDEVLKNNSHNEGKEEYTDKPIVHQYLQLLNKETFGSVGGIMTVGEMSSTTIENCVLYTAPERQELSTTFNFHHLKVDYKDGQKWTKKEFDFEELKCLFHTWGKKMSERNGWNALFWNNHDQPRAINRFVDVKHFRIEGATMLAASIHLSRGTPYIYMGEEIGMLDPDFDAIEDYVDIESINAYQALMAKGINSKEAFEIIKSKSRDNARIPIQWDASENAGFSKGTPWLKVGKSYSQINVESELEGPIFTFYQKLIALRKKMPIIAEGSYQPAYENHPQVYAFERRLGKEKLLVLNNFYPTSTVVPILSGYAKGEVLISNYENIELTETLHLPAYATIAILLR